MPQPYNAALKTILTDLKVDADIAANQKILDGLNELLASTTREEFQTKVQQQAAVFSLELDAAHKAKTTGKGKKTKTTWPRLPPDFITDAESAPAANDGYAALMALAQEKQERFDEFIDSHAAIEAATPDHLALVARIATFTLDPANLKSFHELFTPHKTKLLAEDCQLLIEAAKKKTAALRTASPKDAALFDADQTAKDKRKDLAEAETWVTTANQTVKDGEAELKKYKLAAKSAEHRVKDSEVGFFTLDKERKQQRYQDMQTQAAKENIYVEEVRLAYEQAKTSAAEVDAKVQAAKAKIIEAETLLAEARLATTPAPEAEEKAKKAQQAYVAASQAIESAKLAKAVVETEKKLIDDPKNEEHKRQRANLYLEKNALSGFVDSLVKKGDKVPPAVASTATGGITLSHGSSTQYEAVRVNEGDEIHSTQKFAGGEAHLVQDSHGNITDKSSGTLTPQEKIKVAIKQAKMLLSNYKPEKGAIYIHGGPLDQAQRVYAALLLISQNNPHIKLTAANIVAPEGCAPVGLLTSQNSYIKQHLGQVSQSELKLEQQNMVDKFRVEKEKFQGIMNVEDLPVGTLLDTGKPSKS